MADYNDWLEELAKRSGAGVGETDLANLQGKNPEDVAMFQQDLEAQYARRGASGQTGSGPEGSTVRAPSDIAKGFGPGGSNENPAGRGMARTNVAQSWLTSGGNTGYNGSGGGVSTGNGFMANQDPRAAELYQELIARSTERPIDRNDPIIRAQADAFSAQQDRSRRNYLSDTAEREGPYANLQGERRMAAERAGQASGAFEAQLMSRELMAEREKVAQALSGRLGMLSGDQQAALTERLAALDAEIRREGFALQGQGMFNQNDQFMRDLALRESNQNNYWDYNWAGFGG